MNKRIAISVPAEVAARIKKAAGEMSVAAWVISVIEERLDEGELERLWQEFYASVDPRRRDIRRAEAILQRLTKPAGKSVA